MKLKYLITLFVFILLFLISPLMPKVRFFTLIYFSFNLIPFALVIISASKNYSSKTYHLLSAFMFGLYIPLQVVGGFYTGFACFGSPSCLRSLGYLLEIFNLIIVGIFFNITALIFFVKGEKVRAEKGISALTIINVVIGTISLLLFLYFLYIEYLLVIGYLSFKYYLIMSFPQTSS